MRGTPTEEEEILKREEALALEAMEHSLELERLETRERQVALAEDAVGAREARAQEDVDRRVAEARADILGRYDLKLKLVEAEAAGRTTALKSRLTEAERHEEAAAATLVLAHAELASARAKLLPLQQRVANAECIAQQNREEVLQRRTLERVHAPMLQDLRNRANAALGHICDENAPHPHANDYASNLRFFTDVVMRLEHRSKRARQLVKERAFASEDDAVVVAADEGDMVDDGDGGASDGVDDASDASEGDPGDAASDMSF
nr:hyaluronan-mediated motility receptor-like [Aegilops tauschii subsp. strangulata]